MACFIAHLPNWIQALAAVALVFLTWRSLLILRKYAEDTKRIADKSVEQIENAQKPFLALVIRTLEMGHNEWVIENQGSGPALNIRHSDPRGEDIMFDMPPLAKGDFNLLKFFDRQMVARNGFTIQYASLGGIGYITSVSWLGDSMRTVVSTIPVA
jgi:hypothetical protein